MSTKNVNSTTKWNDVIVWSCGQKSILHHLSRLSAIPAPLKRIRCHCNPAAQFHLVKEMICQVEPVETRF